MNFQTLPVLSYAAILDNGNQLVAHPLVAVDEDGHGMIFDRNGKLVRVMNVDNCKHVCTIGEVSLMSRCAIAKGNHPLAPTIKEP